MLIGIGGPSNSKNLEVAVKLPGFQVKSLWKLVLLELVGPMMALYKVNPMSCPESALEPYYPLINFHHDTRQSEDPEYWFDMLRAYSRYDLENPEIDTVIWDCTPSSAALINEKGGLTFFVQNQNYPREKAPQPFRYLIDISVEALVADSAVFIQDRVKEHRHAKETGDVDVREGGGSGATAQLKPEQ